MKLCVYNFGGGISQPPHITERRQSTVSLSPLTFWKGGQRRKGVNPYG